MIKIEKGKTQNFLSISWLPNTEEVDELLIWQTTQWSPHSRNLRIWCTLRWANHVAQIQEKWTPANSERFLGCHLDLTIINFYFIHLLMSMLSVVKVTYYGGGTQLFYTFITICLLFYTCELWYNLSVFYLIKTENPEHMIINKLLKLFHPLSYK